MEIQEEILRKMSRDITLKKEAVIKKRLEELKLDHLLVGIENKRFSPLCCEIKEGKETWFANYGSENGVRVVTFFDEKFSGFSEDTYKMGIDIKYY